MFYHLYHTIIVQFLPSKNLKMDILGEAAGGVVVWGGEWDGRGGG